MESILTVTTIQAWFFAFMVLSFKKEKELSDIILITWFLFIGLHTASFYITQSSGIRVLSTAFPLLQGPFLYLYILSKTNLLKKLKVQALFHLIPFLAFVGYQLYYSVGITFNNQIHHTPFLSLSNPFGSLFICSLVVYIIFSLKLILSSNDNKVWNGTLIGSMTAIWISSVITMFFPNTINHQFQIIFDNLIFIILTGFVYIASYFGFRENIFNTDIPRIGKNKYEKNALSKKEKERIWNDLQMLMKEDLFFTNPKLNLNDLAVKLETIPNKLSQVINEKSQRTYYDFTNSFRVNYAKQLIDEGHLNQRTLLAIAYDSGFSSKSTFNRAFKKIEGVTPSVYSSTKV